ncbi:hypothetical protein PHYBLDRAFT_161801 [Phycomyces blakesleeanus NRRL 1555(-)]|uniref:Uncharacterized protein n=1 Tax=Phycomyces blakesleeanus (strain ATCC 8743b / DSM 1359 / FGSC 10004 / NBRC 33097 / NRRL 1555) TaxID=763407 RepID=A0A162VA05_PHYB8|nr:hypothetical protein PHYBLDRAFT_161801 [Phycomyces blakesleeanus NRRL 1555(-)]OAD81173.1 hypothetical protein PHYBLDRAFT_161801 [Phycomyces blakesleeanus NRRL 1555(-)]|eukprot:XP_018299213.1 hypothetical protein PHYBLDRAFT_161801 [Phycomyces blakesleeanus NRRL 1555(-)]
MTVILELEKMIYFCENIPQQYSLLTEDAFLILLCQMTYPTILKDILIVFGKSKSTISKVFNNIINKLVQKFEPALLFDYHQFWAPVEHCVGFIDERLWPEILDCYNSRCRIEDIMKKTFDIRGKGCVTLDNISLLKFHTYILDSSNPDHKDVNTAMSSVRIVVENEFAHVASLFAFIKYLQSQHIFLCPVRFYYLVAILLNNFHNCFNREKQTSKRFGVISLISTEYIDDLLGNT